MKKTISAPSRSSSQWFWMAKLNAHQWISGYCRLEETAYQRLYDAEKRLYDRNTPERDLIIPMTDHQIRNMWKTAGGEFHGPCVETASIPERDLFDLIRRLVK